MARTYKTEGIVLKRINYSEADKIITIFSKHYGKIQTIAKGVRKLTSRKGGNLELFNLVTIFLAKGKNLDIITEAQVQDSFSGFRENLEKTAVAFQLAELVERLTRENQANYKIFNLLKDSLSVLSKKDIDQKSFLIEFKIGLLQVTGFGLPEKINEDSLDKHIEKIIEKKLFSVNMLDNRKLN